MSSKPAKNQTTLSQVKFSNIAKNYRCDEDIKITYTMEGFWKPSTSDWIGLFQEGVDDVKNYITYMWSTAPSNILESNKKASKSVTFREYYLPRDKPGVYYFSYVTRQGNVRGKSCTFFIGPEEESCSVESDFDSDLVFVEAGFGDFEKLNTELDELKKDNFVLRKQLDEEKAQKNQIRNLLQAAEDRVQVLSDAVMKQQDEKEKIIKDKETSENGMKEKIARLLQKINEHQDEKNSLLQRLKRVERKNEKELAASQLEIENLKRSLEEEKRNTKATKISVIKKVGRKSEPLSDTSAVVPKETDTSDSDFKSNIDAFLRILVKNKERAKEAGDDVIDTESSTQDNSTHEDGSTVSIKFNRIWKTLVDK